MTGIELNALTKSYGDVRAVRGIDISVGAGETVALLGPNGACTFRQLMPLWRCGRNNHH